MRRPWYTFNVDNSIALCVQHVTEERAAPKPERTLEVSDCGGVCSLAYGSGTIRIGNALPISLKVCDQTIPLSTVVALFFRVEECEGDSYETVLFEVKLHDDSDSPILGEAQIDSVIPLDTLYDTMSEKVTSDASIAGKSATVDSVSVDVSGEDEASGSNRDASGTFLVPNFAWNGSAEEMSDVSLRYFLRLLVVTRDGKRFWNTNEITVWRSALKSTPSPPPLPCKLDIAQECQFIP